MITWHGISSDDVGVRVEHYPSIPIPVRRQMQVQVPGRNGAILISEPTFDNVLLNYDIYITESANVTVVTRAVLEWLLVEGYQELTDSYDTGITRLAYFDTSDPIDSIWNRFGRVTLTFNAKPQRYITTAMTATAVSSGDTLDNPTMNDAKPLIVCHGTGTGQLTVGNDVIDLADSEIVLDSENMQAYYDGTNMNNQMAGEFPVLSPGSTGISWSGGISSVEVAPRWFYL